MGAFPEDAFLYPEYHHLCAGTSFANVDFGEVKRGPDSSRIWRRVLSLYHFRG